MCLIEKEGERERNELKKRELMGIWFLGLLIFRQLVMISMVGVFMGLRKVIITLIEFHLIRWFFISHYHLTKMIGSLKTRQ